MQQIEFHANRGDGRQQRLSRSERQSGRALCRLGVSELADHIRMEW